ncbi:MAG: hypothetical protein ACRERR_12360 [Moraxellaceae bacterium]
MKSVREKLSLLRQWANRDDGRFYRVENRPLRGWETSFLLLVVLATMFWALHEKVGF